MSAVPLAIPATHPVFAGHFPGRPVLPGALLLDHVILALEGLRGCAAGTWQVANAKFLSPAGPGEALVVEFDPPGPRGAVAFRVRAGGRPVASGSLLPLEPR
jgi:3-hydroxyacyl-[acyl-carrier-protein] dehydratase